MRILGCVKEVNELELVISLPNGLQGCVQVTEICDAYTEKLNEQVAQEEPLQVRETWMKSVTGGRCKMTALLSAKKERYKIPREFI